MSRFWGFWHNAAVAIVGRNEAEEYRTLVDIQDDGNGPLHLNGPKQFDEISRDDVGPTHPTRVFRVLTIDKLPPN